MKCKLLNLKFYLPYLNVCPVTHHTLVHCSHTEFFTVYAHASYLVHSNTLANKSLILV